MLAGGALNSRRLFGTCGYTKREHNHESEGYQLFHRLTSFQDIGQRYRIIAQNKTPFYQNRNTKPCPRRKAISPTVHKGHVKSTGLLEPSLNPSCVAFSSSPTCRVRVGGGMRINKLNNFRRFLPAVNISERFPMSPEEIASRESLREVERFLSEGLSPR